MGWGGDWGGLCWHGHAYTRHPPAPRALAGAAGAGPRCWRELATHGGTSRWNKAGPGAPSTSSTRGRHRCVRKRPLPPAGARAPARAGQRALARRPDGTAALGVGPPGGSTGFRSFRLVARFDSDQTRIRRSTCTCTTTFDRTSALSLAQRRPSAARDAACFIINLPLCVMSLLRPASGPRTIADSFGFAFGCKRLHSVRPPCVNGVQTAVCERYALVQALAPRPRPVAPPISRRGGVAAPHRSLICDMILACLRDLRHSTRGCTRRSVCLGFPPRHVSRCPARRTATH